MSAQIQTDIETISNKSEGLVNQEINNELLYKLIKHKIYLQQKLKIQIN